jgi:hypothetical protein
MMYYSLSTQGGSTKVHRCVAAYNNVIVRVPDSRSGRRLGDGAMSSVT